jgi:hypothetical protein
MLDHAVLQSVAEQMMAESENPHSVAQNGRRIVRPTQVGIDGKSFGRMRTGSGRFRTVRFQMGGKGYQAIEQNPEKPSRWGRLARDGHRVVQFRDVGSGKYVAVVVDGKVTEYGG